MSYKEKYPTENDIYTLYDFYRQYKQYYTFYWTHQNNINEEDIIDRIREIYGNKKLGGVIDALCFYANIPKSDLFNNDDTPKDINELDVLKMIKEANYGKTND